MGNVSKRPVEVKSSVKQVTAVEDTTTAATKSDYEQTHSNDESPWMGHLCSDVEDVQGVLVDWLIYKVRVQIKDGSVLAGTMNQSEFRRLIAREGGVFRMSGQCHIG